MCSQRNCHGSHGKGYKCKCQLNGFLRPCLLLLLLKGEGYGYTLQQKLQVEGLVEEVDMATIYRNLRFLENAKLISSKWQSSESGPEKRVYTITTAGRDSLLDWKQALITERDRIEQFLTLLGKEEL